MNLPPKEKDQLLMYIAGLLAERRLQRGLRLNYPEAIAYISLHVLEGARDGRTVAEVVNSGRTLLSVDQVMNGIETKVREVTVEATFREGTQWVTIYEPIMRMGDAPKGVC